jgi:hypothetical protein
MVDWPRRRTKVIPGPAQTFGLVGLVVVMVVVIMVAVAVVLVMAEVVIHVIVIPAPRVGHTARPTRVVVGA